MKISFHFNEHGEDRRRWFGVGPDLVRRVPMEIENVDGLNTVNMWFDKEGKYLPGDNVLVEAATIFPQGYVNKVKIGSKGRLWEGGFFADIKIIEIDEDALRCAAQQSNS